LRQRRAGERRAGRRPRWPVGYVVVLMTPATTVRTSLSSSRVLCERVVAPYGLLVLVWCEREETDGCLLWSVRGAAGDWGGGDLASLGWFLSAVPPRPLPCTGTELEGGLSHARPVAHLRLVGGRSSSRRRWRIVVLLLTSTPPRQRAAPRGVGSNPIESAPPHQHPSHAHGAALEHHL